MNQSAENDLDILFPDRNVPVGGRNVLVRELLFTEQIRHHHALVWLSAAFAAVVPLLENDDGVNHVLDLLAEHWDQVYPLVAASCSAVDATDEQIHETAQWISQQRGAEGELLLLTWWTVNKGFFVRRLLRPLQVAREKAQVGARSSQPSSQQDTPLNNCTTTPNAS